MECTQKLECTQELYETHTVKVCPEQIGFLGICGTKHPVLRGPNKIGRDPQACNIVLNLNSVSRQHAVINVLNSKEFMVMDLDSANKTKLVNKTLQPYIPHPIRDGDTVQFGDIFGIFRLLEENDELPMTQAIDIPETPVQSRHVSKLNKIPTTMIPESPDVISDRDDSFATPSGTKNETTRLSSGQFIKPFGKTISIHPIISPKTDTPVSSKGSGSFNRRNTSLNKSVISPKDDNKVDNIHEMATQVPYLVSNTDSIYTADTQVPPGHIPSPSIHSMDTQIPQDHLPQIRKINDQQEMQFDIYAANKENDLSIFNAETQPFICEKDELKTIKSPLPKKMPDVSPENVKGLNKSEEELLFDEIDDGCMEDFNSQPLLPQESPKSEMKSPETLKKNAIVESDGSTDCEDIDMLPTQKVEELPTKTEKFNEKVEPTTSKRRNRINSDSSTDCEDIELMPTQKIPELPIKNDVTKSAAKRVNRIQSDSSTDCEDIALMTTQKISEKKTNEDEEVTDCEDDLIEMNAKDRKEPSKDVGITKFEDMPTQVIDTDPNKVNKPAFEDMDTQIIDEMPAKSTNDDSFEDQPTQIIDEIIPNNTEAAKKSFKDVISPFKIPLQSPLRVKSKEIPKAVFKDKTPETVSVEDDDNYYNATQDILDDLCTQRDGSPILRVPSAKAGRKSPIIIDDDIVPCSVEDYKVGERFSNIDRDLSPTKSFGDQRAKLAANLSSQEVRDVIGVDAPVDKLKKIPSGDSSSDVERTPKKVRSFLFTDSDLPNSQEIKSNIFVNNVKSYVTDSSSESELECTENTEDQNTPFVHRRKKKPKTVAKIDLTKKFDVEKLPERIITRVRKPTAKMEENLKHDKKANANILKPKFLTEQEDQIDEDIIIENVKRLKTYEKAKSIKDNKNDIKTENDKNGNKSKDNKTEIKSVDNKTEVKPKEVKNESTTEIKTDNKSNESKEKIKVKIERPKKKDDQDKKSKEGSSRKRKEKSIDKNKSNEDSLHSTSDVKTARSTRSRRKATDNKTSEKKSTSPENIKKEINENKRKRPTKKREPPKESVSPEVEIRRSRRQAIAKEKQTDSQEMITQAPKSILKKSIHEQSTVYNVSSSSTDSPRNLKRSLVDDSEVPSPKRTRAFVNNENNSTSSVSLRATPARTMKTQHVLFTAFPSEEVKHKLEKLGAMVVTDVMQCSIVLTMQVKRTFKLLCAVGLGRPIVGPSWVQACVDTHMIVDPWLYIIKDESAEKRFQFNLEKTLNGKRNFLKGYNVSSTPSVQPNASEMKLIVECSGGAWKEGGSNWICVSCTKDQALWPALRKRGAIVVSTEFILGGVLKQKLEINTNKFP